MTTKYNNKPIIESMELILQEMKSQRNQRLSTGFESIDKLLNGGLPVGLSILGAIPGMGKTTFLLQIADEMAKNGHVVHYFAYEMSRVELVSKSLSRISYADEKIKPLTTDEIIDSLQNSDEDEVNKTLIQYEKSAYTLFIHQCDHSVTFEELKKRVLETKTRLQDDKKTVIIVDYLQIMPMGGTKSEKQHLDQLVPDFKRLSRDAEICVILISSLNRSNYYKDLDFSSYKESGSIEYGADIISGLQFIAKRNQKNKAKNPSDSIQQERELIFKEKVKATKDIEFVLLKNRNGIGVGKVNLAFHSKYHYFEEVVEEECW